MHWLYTLDNVDFVQLLKSWGENRKGKCIFSVFYIGR